MQRLQPKGKERRFFEIALDNRIRDALCCPAGPALVVYWSRHVLHGQHAVDQSTRLQLEANSTIVASRLREFIARPVEDIKLSPRELAVLRQLVFGKHLGEVAEYLRISIFTARTLLRRAQRKLGAKTPLQAAVRAVQRGLI